MNRTLFVGLSMVFLLAACAASPDTPADEPNVSVPDNLVSPVDIARFDLAARLGSEDGIVVVHVENLMWRDGSLGCPQPGMSYTQALVDGYRIGLSDGEVTYFYHGAVGRDPFLCEKADEPGSGASGDTVAPRSQAAPPTSEGGIAEVDETPVSAYDGPLVELVAIAAGDLAERLSVSIDEVVVVSAESVVWPDGSIGCPIPDMRYTQVQVDGTKIVLSVNGGTYSYHSGGSRGSFLCVPAKTSSGTTGLTLPGLDE